MELERINEFLRGDFSKSIYVERARQLVPVLKERAARQWRMPRLLEETVADMQDAGFFQMLQPKRWGGAETSPIESFEVTSILAEADPSVGWVLGVIGVHAYHLAFFSDKAQEEVWGSNTKTLISSPYAPCKAEKVDGGFVLSGRWGFSSGSDYCDWTFLGGAVASEDPNEEPRVYAFLLPRSDYEIIHNWDVSGLRSTGSNDIVVKDAFIPEHRALAWEEAESGRAPGFQLNTGALYQIPFFQIFSRATQPPAALGALQGMLNEFLARNSGKVARDGMHIGQNSEVNKLVAEALTSVSEMKFQVYQNYARIIASLNGGPQVSMDERRMFRFQAAYISARCAEFATRLFRLAGGYAIYENQPFGRYMNDLLAIQTHQLCNYQTNANAWIGTLLGYAKAAEKYPA